MVKLWSNIGWNGIDDINHLIWWYGAKSYNIKTREQTMVKYLYQKVKKGLY